MNNITAETPPASTLDHLNRLYSTVGQAREIAAYVDRTIIQGKILPYMQAHPEQFLLKVHNPAPDQVRYKWDPMRQRMVDLPIGQAIDLNQIDPHNIVAEQEASDKPNLAIYLRDESNAFWHEFLDHRPLEDLGITTQELLMLEIHLFYRKYQEMHSSMRKACGIATRHMAGFNPACGVPSIETYHPAPDSNFQTILNMRMHLTILKDLLAAGSPK